MKYKGTLLAVKDMEKAKAFYNSVLGFKHSWGQRAIRFDDLDNHIIEVAAWMLT